MTLAPVTILHKVTNARMSPCCIFRMVLVDPDTCRIEFPLVASVSKLVAVPKAITFASGVYMSAPLLCEIVLAELPSLMITMIQLVVGLPVVTSPTTVKSQRIPTMVHGKVAVLSVVCVLDVVAF